MTVMTIPQKIFPWLSGPWQQLWQSKQQQNLAHALLFMGTYGLGKKELAQYLAKALLCNNANDMGDICGSCAACHLTNANSHPDLMIIEPAESGKAIGVDQIRGVVKFVNETTIKGGYRIIIINPATAMNINAANALLKTLEEPTPNTLIILISEPGMRLPRTILSRCRKILFSKPSSAVAVEWLHTQLPPEDYNIEPQLLLKLADGSPLRALALLQKDLLSVREDLYDGLHALSENLEDPIKFAEKWLDADHLCVVDLMLSWLTDLLRYKLTQDPDTLLNTDYKTKIVKVGLTLLHANLMAFIEQLQQTRADLLSSVNLNKQLLLEDLFIRWTDYVSR